MSELRWGDSDSSSEDDGAPKVSEIMNREKETRENEPTTSSQGRGKKSSSPRRQNKNKNKKSGQSSGKSDWKEIAKSSAKFSTDKNETLNGISWMEQRRAKQQQSKEEEEKEKEKRLKEETEKKRERRKTQFAALKVRQEILILIIFHAFTFTSCYSF